MISVNGTVVSLGKNIEQDIRHGVGRVVLLTQDESLKEKQIQVHAVQNVNKRI